MPSVLSFRKILSFCPHTLQYVHTCTCAHMQAHIYFYIIDTTGRFSTMTHGDAGLNRQPYTSITERDYGWCCCPTSRQRARDETSVIPLIKPPVILLETVFLFSPLHVHCPNPCFRGKGIKGNYNVSFASRLQGWAWRSNAITWWQRWSLKPGELPGCLCYIKQVIQLPPDSSFQKIL